MRKGREREKERKFTLRGAGSVGLGLLPAASVHGYVFFSSLSTKSK